MKQNSFPFPKARAPAEVSAPFPARLVWSIAAADLHRRWRYRHGNDHRPQYVFVARHVRAAMSPTDLIRRALNNRYEGIYGVLDDVRRRLYSSEVALIEALALGDYPHNPASRIDALPIPAEVE